MAITNLVAYEQPEMLFGVLEANVDMSVESTWQYTGVDAAAATGSGLTGPAALVAPASAGAAILGVLQNNPQLAEAGTVMCLGVSKILCGGTFSIGQILAVNAAGKFVVATSGQFGVAKALEAGVSGIIACALIGSYGKQ
jgi:hypothetical protein